MTLEEFLDKLERTGIRGCHFANLRIRKDGKWKEVEADFLYQFLTKERRQKPDTVFMSMSERRRLEIQIDPERYVRVVEDLKKALAEIDQIKRGNKKIYEWAKTEGWGNSVWEEWINNTDLWKKQCEESK